MKMKSKSSKSKKYTGKVTFPLGADEVAGLRRSLAWTYRALGTGVALLEMTDEAFMEAVFDDDRFPMMVQMVKMIWTDSRYAESQQRIRDLIDGRMRYAFLERQHPDSKPLIESPIDFSLLPDAPGLSPELVNSVRPY
jgi:hypothetical protein